MNSNASRSKLGNIALVIDERLSRDRRGVLSRVINALRHIAVVQLIPGETEEAALIKRLETEKFSLVLAPWYRYLAWTRVEAFYGLIRNSGPTFAGYFSEPIKPHELGPQADHLRAILLDYAHTTAGEAALLTKALLVDRTRSGVRPLLDPQASVYTENWYTGQGLGLRVDNVMSLPEIARTEWASRAPALRILMSALWSLVYEEGPGKSELTQAIAGAKTPRACFQVGADSTALLLRLCYAMPGWSAKDALASFWPDAERPTASAQLLLKYADFLRVHTLDGSNDVEVVAGLLGSRPADKSHAHAHTLWVEPLAPQLVSEIPFEDPSPRAPFLKALPSIGLMDPRAAKKDSTEDGAKAKERFIFEAAIKIRELKKLLADRDELIRDLKSGGVGTAQPLPPPDAETLLEAFQERYHEAKFQIRRFEAQINEMERKGATPQEIEALRLKMAALAAREQGWLRKIAQTLAAYRAERAGNGG